MCPSLFSSWPSFLSSSHTHFRDEAPSSLGPAHTFDKTTPEMSSTPPTGVPTMAHDGPPRLEKKPVKFSNLLRECGPSQRGDCS